MLRALCMAEQMEQSVADSLYQPAQVLAFDMVDDGVLCLLSIENTEWIYTPEAETTLRSAWQWSIDPGAAAAWCARERSEHNTRMWLASKRLTEPHDQITDYLAREAEHARRIEEACASH